MKILVIGATGQIGYAMAKRLAADPGFEVSVFARKPRAVQFPVNIRIQESESLDAVILRELLAETDHVLYAVGTPEKWVKDTGIFETVNVRLLEIFLSVLAEFPKVSLTYFSTFEVFRPKDGRISESGDREKRGATPYYQSMIDALERVQDYAGARGIRPIFIHPAAVYGGLDTGKGITEYLLNLKHRNYFGTPSILPGEFPIVHTDSLAAAVIAAIKAQKYGEHYVVSDAYVSLKELAKAAKRVFAPAYQPLELPAGLVKVSALAMDALADWITRSPPILSSVQVKYITQSHEIDCSKAMRELGWIPMTLEEGIRHLFSEA